MATSKITADVLASHLRCKYKGYLQLAGENGVKSEYETRVATIGQGFRQKVIHTLLAGKGNAEVARDPILTHRLLKQGSSYILGATLEDDDFSLHFDALKRADGASPLGPFHYTPLLFHNGDAVHQDQKRLIALYGHVLSGLQGRWPTAGIVVYGPECKMQKVALTATHRKAGQVFHEIRAVRETATPPPLVLNDHCPICEFRDRCHAQAVAEDNLSLLRGMTEKDIRQHNRRGIFTVTQLSYTYRLRRKSARKAETSPHHSFPLQAFAIRDKQVFLASLPVIPAEPVCIYLDLEGIPERRFDYLIGALVCTPASTEHHSFWADTSDQECAIFRAFLDLAASFDRYHIFHYGAYEAKCLKRIRSNPSLTARIDRVLTSATNILSLIYGRIYFPVYSNGLKDVASALGYAWTDKAASGLNSMVWRREWELTRSPGLKDRLLAYNRDDCAALKLVSDFIRGASIQVRQNGPDAGEEANRGIQVAFPPEAAPQFTRPNWGTPQFAQSDFEYINRCAFFDYQREKVYAHTCDRIARGRARPKRRPRKPNPQGSIIVESSRCPECGGSEVAKVSKRICFRQFFDLRVKATCVRRVYKRVGSYKYRCAKCGRTFFPERFVNMAKYGHALKSWVIYEHVAHRASFENLEETLRDVFSLSVRFRDIHVFKSIMANYYRETYFGIIRSLSRGDLLHADETEVHLKRVGKGYVWVFTNLEEVLYVYRASRDGKFLEEMFAGFSGVVVSDFYAVYDSLGCAQQKCLVHLIRDLNTQLLSNPFDTELKAVVSDFGGLLRRVVATVDRYGLKRRHLGKHQREVDRFFVRLAGNCFSSDSARAVQERMLRNRDSLFTFLRYDGVPWNNNNAEHAVKQFAYYREVTDGQLSEAGLMDYLVLLSIKQTCEYKGLGFLRFLLSGETDLDSYREKSRTHGRKETEVQFSPLERGFFDKENRRRAPPVHWSESEKE
jgi:predicted RecB family nuclease